jgi:hypothetical protein
MADSKSATQTVDHADTIEPVQRSPAPVVEGGEKAAQYLAQHGEVVFAYDEEKAVLRRIDMRILPLILGAYFFQQLDKSALSYTSIFGIMDDAHLKGTEYSWLGMTPSILPNYKLETRN